LPIIRGDTFKRNSHGIDFKEIEEKLGLILPEFYKLALLNYPFKPLDEIDCVKGNLVKELDWIATTNLEHS